VVGGILDVPSKNQKRGQHGHTVKRAEVYGLALSKKSKFSGKEHPRHWCDTVKLRTGRETIFLGEAKVGWRGTKERAEGAKFPQFF